MKNRWVFIVFAILWVVTTTGCSSEHDNTDESTVFEVYTTVSGTSNYYIGLPMQIGLSNSSENSIATGTIGADGKISFSVDMIPYIGQTVCFCVPKVVKFFHTLTTEEVAGGSITLPDKEQGCTLQTSDANKQAGGKYYVNDWIVAVYMGTHKDAYPDVPLYWATGNIIGTKLSAEGETTKASFHFSTISELIAQTKSEQFLGTDSKIALESMDGYSNFPIGTQWDRFHYGDISGIVYYSGIRDFINALNQVGVFDISGIEGYDIACAYFGGKWRIPTGGLGEYNEFAPFEDDNEEYAHLEPNGTEWVVDGVNIGCKYEYAVKNNGSVVTVNSLYFPWAGFRHDIKEAGRGQNGWYRTGTADRQGLRPFMPEGFPQPPTDENTNAYCFGLHDGLKEKIVHPRISFECIRPVTE